MKNHEWKALGRVIYGSRKTAFFEERKANFAARLNCTHHFDAAANWIEGEFSSILRLTERFSRQRAQRSWSAATTG
jgi:hypothetical protein